MRLHYEDLAADPDAARASVRAFLGLGAPDVQPPAPGKVPAQAPAGAPAPEPAPAQAPAGAPDREPSADLPLEQIPPALLAQVNQLHAELGYPRLGAS
jgi:hypothetical protein